MLWPPIRPTQVADVDREIRSSITRALFGPEALGKELTVHASTGAQAVLRAHQSRFPRGRAEAPSAADVLPARMRLRVARAAYQCMTTIVLRTQSQVRGLVFPPPTPPFHVPRVGVT